MVVVALVSGSVVLVGRQVPELPVPQLVADRFGTAVRIRAEEDWRGRGGRCMGHNRVLPGTGTRRRGSGKMEKDPVNTRKQRLPGDDRRPETRSSRRRGQEDAEVIRMHRLSGSGLRLAVDGRDCRAQRRIRP